jgi:hypothetical protein
MIEAKRLAFNLALVGLVAAVVMDERDYLPRTLPFGRLDTGIPLNERLAALLVGVGDGMQSGYGLIDRQFNPERQKVNDALLSELLKNPHVGTNARVGTGLGLLADPGNLLLSPIMRHKK